MKQAFLDKTNGQETHGNRNRAFERVALTGTLRPLHGFNWAVLEWECAVKDSEVGAREGSQFIAAHIIEVAKRSFDDFAAKGSDQAANRAMLGLSA